MSKKYDNEFLLVESLLNNHYKVNLAQKHIKEQYGLSSLFDDNLSLLYIWNENKEDDDNLLKAEDYIKETFSEYLLDVDIYKPEVINEEIQEIFTIYLKDHTLADICSTEDEAKKAVNKLNKEYPGNEATYKKEKKSNYVKQ